MSLSRSLKTGGSLMQHRSVLTRAERIEKLREDGRFQDGDGPLGLPKVVSRKAAAGKKTKKKTDEEETAATEES
ncbi:MAG: small basic protein [Planctomycetes bacterium]|nr:small basic protein [Planctomycetota bacterium]NOG54337.1 small basic protein [Planctomycetota bacterium]